MATRGIYLPVELEARMIQVAVIDDRSVSKMIQILCEEGLKTWYQNRDMEESKIADAEAFVLSHKEVKA